MTSGACTRAGAECLDWEGGIGGAVPSAVFRLRGVVPSQGAVPRGGRAATGGLKVHTTMDLALQERAERLVLEDGLEMINGQDKGEAALVAIDPASGGVRVLVGGREYTNSPFNRAVLARRTSGSAFKPFVYLTALAEGVVNPSSLIQDEEQIFEVPEGDEKTYKPRNYTREFKGTVSLRDCLVESLNVPTVKVAEMVGIDRIVAMARRLGITSPFPNARSPQPWVRARPRRWRWQSRTPSIAAGGVYSKPHLITKVRDKSGATVYRPQGCPPRRREGIGHLRCTACFEPRMRAAPVATLREGMGGGPCRWEDGNAG